MLNLRNQSTRRIDVRINADVSSGALKFITGILGIPVENKLSGNTVAFIQEGIVALTFNLQGTIGAGSYLYYSVANALLTLGHAIGDIEVGQVIGPDPDGVATRYLVRMNIGFPRQATVGAQAAT